MADTTTLTPPRTPPTVVPARGWIKVENPATGEVASTVPTVAPEQVAEMVARGREAQPGWAEMGFEGRGRVLLRTQKWLLDNSRRVIETIVSETGKTYEDAQTAEIGYVVPALGYWVRNAPRLLAGERVPGRSPLFLGKRISLRYRPVGVVGVIGPWNYPLTNCFGDAIPALVAGNAVVVKPSELTPLTSLLTAEMLEECGLPEYVYQVATGYGDVGAELVDHVDYLMFTGSIATGRKVAERAGRALTPVGLELGGKDPMIVLADADLERAANAATWYSMQNGGQTCISVERAYVEAPVYDEFVSLVMEKVGGLRQGVPAGPGSVDVGAVTSATQADTVDAHVRDALIKGAKVAVGGRLRRGRGQFYEPTVLVDVDHSMLCMTEETFGPTLPIMKVADADEAVALANDSRYGLQSSVWTRNVARGRAIAARLESGVASVNEHQINYLAFEAPMGGWKQSGIGSRHGAEGIRKYTRQQVSVVSRRGLRREPFMFPYRRRKTALLGGALRLLHGRGER